MAYIHDLNSVYYMKVAGRRMPGITEVEGNNGSPRKWDKQGGYGLSGSTLKFTGKDLATFDSITSIYTKEELDDWKLFADRVLFPVPRKALKNSSAEKGTGTAFDVWHPKLVMFSIGKAVVENISLPKVTDEGVVQIQVNWIQYREPRFQLVKLETSADRPPDEYERQLIDAAARLEAEARG